MPLRFVDGNLTQRQLADALSISDKTISKWECGKGLPEASLMLPLCEALDITVNDLLSGEKVFSTDYQKKAEENMMKQEKRGVVYHYWRGDNYCGLLSYRNSRIYRTASDCTDRIDCIVGSEILKCANIAW